MAKQILVIKFGTASITTTDGELDEVVISEIARQVAEVNSSFRVILVSSGAVAAGRKYIHNYSGSISERKASAAIGNPVLLSKYAQHFESYGISVAQSLCERGHFSNRKQFLQLRKTYEELWKNGVIPIANENDVVSDLELKFSDNDELATLIAVGFGASMLLFSTSVPGVLDHSGTLVKKIEVLDEQALGFAKKEKSGPGLGGMISKLTFARLATRMGIQVIIFGIRTENGILEAINGNTGTACLPQACSIPARKKWLASGSLVTGRLKVDQGAASALQKRHSLLGVGVLDVVEKFEKGEVFEIIDMKGDVIAVGRAKVSSGVFADKTRLQNLEVSHADDIVLL